jgi:RNA polymerase sigma-70 factor (ECF subfamily)
MAQGVSARAMSCPAGAEAEPETAQPHVSTAELFAAHAGFVLRLVRRLGVGAPEVEDLAQEVFLQVHNTLPRMHPDVPARSWLFGIVRRVVANHRRKLQRRGQLHAEVERTQRTQTRPDGESGMHERWLLDQALERLDADKREIFVLFELEELPMKEVAQLVGCPLQTAYSRLYAARDIVQTFVLGPDPERSAT